MSALGSVKVGDYIAWTTIGDSVSVVRVERVTPTQVITGAWRWRISDGGLVGARGYDCEWARPATDDDMRTARIRSARVSIENAARALSNDDALKVVAFIKSLGVQEAPPAEGE